MSRPVVFAGPSISHEQVRSQQDIECLPPIVRGDINALLDRDEWPDAIGIVDGRFLHALSISPKEVLRAVDQGIPVYGSSSMGALRAVECVPFGMVGVGRIYEEFASGRTDQEDEVAVTFDPEGLRATSEPLISWRMALGDAVERGEIQPAVSETFLTAAKRTYFPDRNLRFVLWQAGDTLSDSAKSEISEVLTRPESDLKRLDALSLVERMTSDLADESRPRPAGVSFRALSTR